MSLLRRREMMDDKEEYAGTLYIDTGFLDNSITVDSPGHYIPTFPDAWATTYFPVEAGDIINCEELRAYNSDSRVRFYHSNGVQTTYMQAGVINVITPFSYATYARLMVINVSAPIPSQLTVTRTDGTIDTYKIIDRR